MKVLVIGGGLMGLTSAYFLAREGSEVILVEREEGAGLGANFANGALLTPSMPEPWNSPGTWRMLLRSLVTSDTALKVRPAALPGLIGWGVKFLRNSAAEHVERATLANLRLALYSLRLMAQMREEISIEYARSARGTLRTFRDPAAFAAATRAAERLQKEGLEIEPLSPAKVTVMEPALAPIGEQLTGALHYPCDESGDALRFCQSLATWLTEHGVQLRFRTVVSGIDVEGDRVTGVRSDAGRLTADHYVIAAGAYSTALLRPLGIDLPVYPAKGYSITIEQRGRQVMSIPLLDDDLHAVIVPLPGVLRVAGTAEFAGFDKTLYPARIDNLFRLLAQVLPEEHFERRDAKPWCGLRPLSADGAPIISRTPVRNLFVNAGHGPLGWTLATASGRLVADLILNRTPEIAPSSYDLRRPDLNP
jgi:D-amino-acid dehydrogenase